MLKGFVRFNKILVLLFRKETLIWSKLTVKLLIILQRISGFLFHKNTEQHNCFNKQYWLKKEIFLEHKISIFQKWFLKNHATLMTGSIATGNLALTWINNINKHFSILKINATFVRISMNNANKRRKLWSLLKLASNTQTQGPVSCFHPSLVTVNWLKF